MRTVRYARLWQSVLGGLLLACLAGAAGAKSETEWYDDGVGLMAQQKFAAAEAAFRAAVQVEPRYAAAWDGLAGAWRAQGKTQQADAAAAIATGLPAAYGGPPPALTEAQKQVLAAEPAAAGAMGPAAEAAEPAGGGPAVVAPPAQPLQPLPALVAHDANGHPKKLAKLSQYDKCGYADLAIGPDGAVHAIFTDQPDNMKPQYLYYRSSANGGASWTPPKNLSDDESGHSASYCRLLADGQGRLYAIWKYVSKDELLDGPGGNGAGILSYRCLSGGAWSPTVHLNDAKLAAYSWFAALGPDGAVRLVWSQLPADTVRVQGWGSAKYANLVQQMLLQGSAPGAVTPLLSPPPLPTNEQIAAARTAGHAIPYDQQRPRSDGLINLRGYVTAAGVTHFVAEQPGITDGPTSQQTGKRIVHWDGTRLRTLYEYERFQTYNNFNNPPTLLVDTHGTEHLIRAPEKAETACVRDYPVLDGRLGDPTEVVAAGNGKGAITHWQAGQLPGGRMVVTTALSEKGGWAPDDVELLVSFSEISVWPGTRAPSPASGSSPLAR